jgi:hypothetical protein
MEKEINGTTNIYSSESDILQSSNPVQIDAVLNITISFKDLKILIIL